MGFFQLCVGQALGHLLLCPSSNIALNISIGHDIGKLFKGIALCAIAQILHAHSAVIRICTEDTAGRKYIFNAVSGRKAVLIDCVVFVEDICSLQLQKIGFGNKLTTGLNGGIDAGHHPNGQIVIDRLYGDLLGVEMLIGKGSKALEGKLRLIALAIVPQKISRVDGCHRI